MEILNSWSRSMNNSISYTAEFINKSKIIGRAFDKSKKSKSEIGFNVFTLTSDLYYRENFHSYIIKSLLDPNEKHNEGAKYLYLFFDLINKINSSSQILKENYENVKVVREQASIDILITDESNYRAIIIENKINNAQDMYRQLPRYYDEVVKKYEVDAIVYITLDTTKVPEKNDWTEDEKNNINKILKIIPAYDRSGHPNIYNDWLIPSIIESNNIDAAFLLRQYADLLKYLNTNNMDTVNLEKFYNLLKENDNLNPYCSF